VKTKTPTASSRPAKRPKSATPSRRAKPAAAKSAVARRAAAKRPAGRHASAASASPRARGARSPKPAPRRGRARRRRTPTSRWLRFVEQHGVVLASARGPVPSIAEAVAGQPIVGSWWAHPKGKAIFAALSELDDADEVRCFKLVDGKVTFVHRRVWPALARLASDGMIAAGRVASIQQEHMPTGEHRNLVTPFPDWVPDDVARAANALTIEAARAQLGAWI
jgi:hypothetical protein